MNVERIIVETNDETCNNPVEYDWEFDPDGVSRMTGEGDILRRRRFHGHRGWGAYRVRR